MNEWLSVLYIALGLFGLVSMVRMAILLIGSDVYDYRHLRVNQPSRNEYQPVVTVIIPAHNEEAGLLRTVESVIRQTYTKKQIIVVNDGSTDATYQTARTYQRAHPRTFTILNQQNAGKAAALNHGIKRARGSLVMVLDADSILHPEALEKSVQYFRDRHTIAVASNIKIIPDMSWLGVTQRIEYMLSFRTKRSLSELNVEYIVGGVGSVFRRSAIQRVGGYDTDTMTEDIDLSVKLIRQFGNTRRRIVYAADSIAYTEHVLSFGALVRQRSRWKIGRLQTLLKHRSLIFNRGRRYNKKLTWIYLPSVLLGDLFQLLEPVMIGYILWNVIALSGPLSLLWIYGTFTLFVFLAIVGETTETLRSKLYLLTVLPAAYVLLYLITIVDFLSLVQSIKQRQVFRSTSAAHSSWSHVKRSGKAVSLPDIIG